MAGNSPRRGATRKPGSKKGARVGTGGHGRKALQGKGPTPKAEDRPYHPAAKRKSAQERGAGAGRSRGSGDVTQDGAGSELVVGRNAVLEALRAGTPVESALFASRLESDAKVREIAELVSERGVPAVEVSRTDLDRLSRGAAHQGVALRVPEYEYADPEDLLDAAEQSGRAPLVVALDSVTDPRNLGAVLRSAAAFGAHGVLLPTRRSAGMTAAAWKVSAGAAARVPVARATNLVRALERFRSAGCFVVGLDAGGETSMADLAFAADPLVLVVGSEGKGLSRLVRETCDAIASIPIASQVESLNAATATGIALYEVARQRSHVAGD